MFECKRCGRCCGIVPFEKKEYNAIREIARKRHIGFVKTEMRGQTVYLPKALTRELCRIVDKAKENKDFDFNNLSCPFLAWDEQGKSACSIYDKRPNVCRLFGESTHPCLQCPNNHNIG